MPVISLTSENFDEKITKQNKLAVVTFSADWCGPCGDFAPKLYSLSKTMPAITVAKVNVDECPALSKQFAINGVPTTIIFDAGKEVDRIQGNVPEDYLNKVVLKRLPAGLITEQLSEPKSADTTGGKPSGLAHLLNTVKQAIRAVISSLTGK